MKPAQDSMRAELDAVDFTDLRSPLVNNWQAREIRAGVEAREGLLPADPQFGSLDANDPISRRRMASRRILRSARERS